jgi:NAD(P)-dependent dehydrogenase (short-subunit alcohol dehydrogenase family)
MMIQVALTLQVPIFIIFLLLQWTNSIIQLLYCYVIDNIALFREDLKGKHVFITGCGLGFGFELAKKLHNKGMIVHANVQHQEHVQNLRDAIGRDSDRLHIYVFDVTNSEELSKCRKRIQEIGQLWALVNNVGVLRGIFVEGNPMRLYRDLFEVNVLSAVSVCKEFLPLLRESRGRIVIMSSVLGRVTAAEQSAYSATKFALEGFADSLRRELISFGVSVTLMEPGSFRTRLMLEGRLSMLNTFEALQSSELRNAYLKLHLQISVVAKAVELLAGNPLDAVADIARQVEARWPMQRALVGWPALFIFAPLTNAMFALLVDWAFYLAPQLLSLFVSVPMN